LFSATRTAARAAARAAASGVWEKTMDATVELVRMKPTTSFARL
jgi:hypothetical protein